MSDETTAESMTDEMWDCLARSEIIRRFREGDKTDAAIGMIGSRFPGAFRIAKMSTIGVLRERGLVDEALLISTAKGRSAIGDAMRRTGAIVEDAWRVKPPCAHPRHDPPSHQVFQEGKLYHHECPSCHEVTSFRGPDRARLGARIGS